MFPFSKQIFLSQKSCTEEILLLRLMLQVCSHSHSITKSFHVKYKENSTSVTKLDHFTTKGGWNDLAQILKQLCSSSLTLREIDYHMLIQCLSRTTQQFLLFVSVLMQEFRLETTSVRNRCWMHSGIQEHHEGDAVDSFVEIILELHLLPFFHFKMKRWSISDDSDYFLKFLFPRSN